LLPKLLCKDFDEFILSKCAKLLKSAKSYLICRQERSSGLCPLPLGAP